MALVVRWSFGLALAAASTLAGCDMASQISDSMTHGPPIASEIERAVGTKPEVFGGNAAGMFFANVQFSEVPAMPVPDIETIARAAIVREYHKEPEMLTISFVYQKKSSPGR